MSAEREAYLAAYIGGAQGNEVMPRQTADEEALATIALGLRDGKRLAAPLTRSALLAEVARLCEEETAEPAAATDDRRAFYAAGKNDGAAALLDRLDVMLDEGPHPDGDALALWIAAERTRLVPRRAKRPEPPEPTIAALIEAGTMGQREGRGQVLAALEDHTRRNLLSSEGQGSGALYLGVDHLRQWIAEQRRAVSS